MTKERDDLLNRLLHAYSGYELRQAVPSYAEAQAAVGGVTKSPEGDSVLGKGIKSSIDLMQEYEDACLQAASGVEDITVRAAKQQSAEDFEKEAKAYEERIVKARTQAQIDKGMMPV